MEDGRWLPAWDMSLLEWRWSLTFMKTTSWWLEHQNRNPSPPPQPINTTSWHFCLTQFTPIRFNWSPRSLHPIHSSLASLRCLAPQRPRSYKGIAPMKEGHLFAFFNGGSILIQQNGMASQLKRNGMLPNSINGHFDGLLFWIHSILFNFWRVPRIVNQKT